MAQETTRRATGTAGIGSVALFIDWDNFAIGLRQEMPERPADVGPILRWARRFGPLTICRAYGEWRDPAERLAIYNAGVEVVYAPVLPLGGSLMARDGGGAKSLADTAEFVSYRQLLDQEGGVQQPVSRPVTVPPMRYPRAPRATVTPLGGPTARALPAPVGRGVRTPPAPPPVTTGTSTATAASVPPGPSSAGSVFASEGEEPGLAARRRRRGGRRRRPGETGGAEEMAPMAAGAEPSEGEAQAQATPEAPEPSEPEREAAVTPTRGRARTAEPRSVEAAAGATASPGTVLPGEEGAPTAPERQTPSASARATEAPEPAPAPPVQRGPVVLPGERLRRLAPSGAPAAPEEAAPSPAAAQPEATAQSETAQPGAVATMAAGGDAETRACRRWRRGRTSRHPPSAPARRSIPLEPL